MKIDLKLIARALSGDQEAARIYCGSYSLVRKFPVAWKDREKAPLYRCKGNIPEGYIKVYLHYGKDVYDKYGFLLPEFWLLPRIEL